MSTEAVPNETENVLQTYQIVYRTVSQETVTEWHHERQLRQLPEMITEISQRLRSRSKGSKLGLNMRIIGSPLQKAPTGMFTKRLTETNAE